MWNIKRIILQSLLVLFLLMQQVQAIPFWASKTIQKNGTRYIHINNDTGSYYLFEFELYTEGYILPGTFWPLAAAKNIVAFVAPYQKITIDSELIALVGAPESGLSARDADERGFREYTSDWFYASEWSRWFSASVERPMYDSFYKAGRLGSRYRIWELNNLDPLVSLLETIRKNLPKPLPQPSHAEMIGKEFLYPSSIYVAPNRQELLPAFLKYEAFSPIAKIFLQETQNFQIISDSALSREMKKLINILIIERTYLHLQSKLPNPNEKSNFLGLDSRFKKDDVNREIPLQRATGRLDYPIHYIEYHWDEDMNGWDFLITPLTQDQRYVPEEQPYLHSPSTLFDFFQNRFKPKEDPSM